MCSRLARFAGVLACIAAIGLTTNDTMAAGSLLGSCPSSADKPQSKLWYNDGFYWAVLQDSDGSWIYRLASGTWQQREHIDAHSDNGAEGHEDVLWNGTHLFVLVYKGDPLLYKFSYDPGTKTYTLLPGFPVEIIPANGSETMVIDQDSTGRLWATYEGNGNIYAAYSTDASHLIWETPGVILQTGVNDDDVSAVVAFGGNKIGVFWSDQNRWEFGFRWHSDSASPSTWSSTEVIYEGSGNSDDHLNLATDATGRIFAITKDVNNEFAVHRRSASGGWTTKGNITNGQTGTRPTIMVDAAGSQLRVAYTCWSCGSPDPILSRTGSASTLSFGSASTILEASSALNDVTDMKQLMPSGSWLLVAAGGGRAYWNGTGSPPAGSGGDGEPGDGEPPPPPPPPPPPGAPGTPIAMAYAFHPTPGVAASYLFDETSGELAFNDAAAGGIGTLGAPGADSAEPLRIAGLEGNALRLDGANDHVLVADHPDIGFPASFTLEAWVRRRALGSPDVIVAKEGSARNYRLRITSSDRVELAWKTLSGSSRTTLGNRIIAAEEWHHIAAVHDDLLGEDRIYVDGVLDIRLSQSGDPGPSADALYIGARYSSGIKEPFGGDLDLVRLSSTVMYGADFAPPASYPRGAAVSIVQLSWPVPTTGGTPTGYSVFRSANAEDEVLVTPATIGSARWTDLDTSDGVYTYRVSASNAQGESPKSPPVTATCGKGATPPYAPPELSARVSQRTEPVAGNAIWSFSEGAGSTTVDETVNGRVLTLGSTTPGDGAEPTWTPGIVGSALTFDGSNDHAQAPDDPLFSFPGSFTLEGWVNFPAVGRYSALISKEGSSAGRNYRLAITLTGKLELQWKDAAGATESVSSTTLLLPGVWQHVAGVFDAAAGENRVYINGQLAGRAPATGTPAVVTSALRLGARQSTSLRDFFAGSLDQVRLTPQALYRDAFTPTQSYAPRNITEHCLAWDAASQGSARLASYKVYRSVQNGPWSEIATTLVGTTACTVQETAPVPACYRVVAIDRLGLASTPSIDRCVRTRGPGRAKELDKAAPEPEALQLSAGPNPFNPTTTIALRLGHESRVSLRVFDVAGRMVRTLADGMLPAGDHRIVWEGRDESRRAVASGVYFLRLDAGGEVRKIKLVLTK